MNKGRVNFGLLLLRLSLGVLLLMHGIAKMMPGGLAQIKGMMGVLNLPAFFAYAALVGEVVAPVMVVLGYRTRIAGFLMAVNMAVAVMSVGSASLLRLSATGGYALELQALYLLGGLALVFTGAGKYAVSTRSRWD